MKLTAQHLEQAKSSKGGWSKQQLGMLGVTWPPIPLWKRTVVGKDFPTEVIESMIKCRDSHLKKDKT